MLNFAVMKNIWQKATVASALLIVAVGSGLLDYFLPAMGDDLMFWNYLGLEEFTAPNRRTVSFILAHIVGCNGRLFDYMGPVVTNLLPRPVASALIGAMAALFFYSIIRAARVPSTGRTAFSMILLTLTLALMPWWDSMYLRVCQFNYLWTSAFCLLFFYYFFTPVNSVGHSPAKNAGLVALGFFAGASHEQAAVTLCVTFSLWALYRRHYRTLTSRQKGLLAGLGAGTLLAVGSPALWNRAATGSESMAPWQLMVITFPILVLLVGVMLGMLTTRSSRNRLRKLLESDAGLMFCAAVISAAIGLYSGIPGRTGMLSEALALSVLARMALGIPLHISHPTAAAASIAALALITAHFSVAVASQRRMGKEYDSIVRLYQQSADGIVYENFTGRFDVSPFTLYRVKGAPDADDYWNLHAINTAYGSPGKNQPVVLPTALKDKLEQISDSVAAEGVTVYTSKPEGITVTLNDLILQHYPGSTPRAIVRTTMSNGREIWVATPWMCDPGDYAVLPAKPNI